MDLHITILENSSRWQAVQRVAEKDHITPEEAADQVFDDGVRVQVVPARPGNLWGLGAEDADVLDGIVSEAMEERRNRFARRLDV
jgi:hypothetical protein